MKAAQINEYGDPSIIEITDVEQPHPTEGKVGIEVHAASINPFDTTVRAGYMKEMIPLQLPVTLGGDLAGVVVEISDDVHDLAIGDKVYGQANVVAGNSGAFAEYAVTSVKQLAKMPNNVDFNQAAALPLVGVSALQALNTHLSLHAGQKLFIHGGAGGIGTVAIQIAKNIGAYVATTATGDGVEYVKQLGADEVIDYKSQNFVNVLHDFDAVFDTVGGEDFNKSFTVLKSGGTAVTMIAEPDETKANQLGIKAIRQTTHATTKALNDLCELVESGVVTPHIDKVFLLDQVKEAFEARETGTIRGKVVLEVK